MAESSEGRTKAWIDPVMNVNLHVDGRRGFMCAKPSDEFQLDFSQYITLVEKSYIYQLCRDQDIAAFVPLSAYTYYMVMLLWRRILYIHPHHGYEYRSHSLGLPKSLPIPREIKFYLDCIGNIDIERCNWKFSFTPELTRDEFYGARGSYGRISAANHLWYETLPAPLIPLLAMRADILKTKYDGDTHWELPEGLIPLAVDNHLPGKPTLDLLGYLYARRLRADQLDMLINHGIHVDGTAKDETVFCVNNVGNIPVVTDLINFLAGLFTHTMPLVEYTTCKLTGSLAQIPFTVRVSEDDKFDENMRAVAKNGITKSYQKFTSHIASASSSFRFRFQRFQNYSQTDSFCYSWRNDNEEFYIPQDWKDNANNVYSGLTKWNFVNFTMMSINGDIVLSNFSDRIYREECE